VFNDGSGYWQNPVGCGPTGDGSGVSGFNVVGVSDCMPCGPSGLICGIISACTKYDIYWYS
jgi:hypothetical protein